MYFWMGTRVAFGRTMKIADPKRPVGGRSCSVTIKGVKERGPTTTNLSLVDWFPVSLTVRLSEVGVRVAAVICAFDVYRSCTSVHQALPIRLSLWPSCSASSVTWLDGTGKAFAHCLITNSGLDARPMLYTVGCMLMMVALGLEAFTSMPPTIGT